MTPAEIAAVLQLLQIAADAYAQQRALAAQLGVTDAQLAEADARLLKVRPFEPPAGAAV